MPWAEGVTNCISILKIDQGPQQGQCDGSETKD